MDDRELLRSSIAEVLGEICDNRSIHRYVDHGGNLPAALLRRAAELGWLAIGVSEEGGGLGLGVGGLAMTAVELGRRLAPGPFIPLLVLAQVLDEHGSAPELRGLLPQLASGARGVALPAELRPASSDGRDLLFGDLAGEAPLIVLPHGAGARLVVPASHDGPVASEGWDRTRGLWRAPAQWTALGDLSPEAFRRLAALFGLLVAADSLGVMKAAFDQTVEYLKTREQFGAPIGSFQALKHRAADLAAKIELADCLVEQGVEAAEAGGEGEAFWSGACKASITDAAVFVAQECLQLHGGVGFTWAYDCHLYLKRARLNQALAQANGDLRDTAFDRLASAVRQGAPLLEIAR
jgi:alkylation response protein AidB-like acyl-CoA dehydrogenase